LGIHPDSFLPTGTAFSPPVQLVALAWWPVGDYLDDVSDMAVWDDRVHLLSDQSSRIASLERNVNVGDELEPERCWSLPDGVTNAEGLIFSDDGCAHVGLDVDLRAKRSRGNLLRFARLSE
jgi:hypothetical protein